MVGHHICRAEQTRMTKFSDKVRWRKENLVSYWNKLALITSMTIKNSREKKQLVLRVWKICALKDNLHPIRGLSEERRDL